MLIHGAWHNSACWAKMTPLLSAGGSRALAIDLPGAGLTTRFPTSYLTLGQAGLADEVSPLRDLSLDTTADAVIAALRGLRAQDAAERRRTVLVGHSLGGVSITRAAQTAPELVDHIVYIGAIAPTKLQTAAGYLGLPEAGKPNPALYLGDAARTGATRINPRTTDLAYREVLRTTFYGDVPEEEFLNYSNALTPDNPTSLATATVGATADRWGTVPRTYVKTLRDNAIAPATQQRMIDDADELTPGNKFRVVPIDSSHSPFASRPQELADILLNRTR